ncbi:hypothetical protein SAMN05216232_2355 [Virgibacillus subterraneus]|uniref:Uncharacterized protein n=2 Tax=Virgibacillus TaxID=84406 RepID=A0A1H1EE14_9BACI|nr:MULTISPECIES: hypothetical protein [Virgibacillus]SDQ86953.1 hypothetical protein SAMN05216231_2845 [Virgibacillus salinus]SEQ42142.1 hypothetical protein SAMN05216232_2355 [Virgibacillus subterraneus]
MKKNNDTPELATFTILNPDFHAQLDQRREEEQLTDENSSNNDNLSDSTD